MFNQIKNYLANLGSNILTFVTAGAGSASSLASSNSAKKIIRPLARISVEDFFPAAMAYFLNDLIQSNLLALENEFSDDESVEKDAIRFLALTANFGLMLFISNRVIQGSARSLALTTAIPHLVNRDLIDRIPSSELYNPLTLNLNSERITSAIHLMVKLLIDEEISFFLPEHYLTKSFFKLLMGYDIVNNALDSRTLAHLTQNKVNSLPLLVGSTYVLGTILKDMVSTSGTNPYLDLLISNCLFISLFAVVANLQLRGTSIRTEVFSLDPAEIVESLSPEQFLHPAYLTINNMALEHRNTIKAQGRVVATFLKILAGKIFPEIIRSPEGFFNDPVLRDLIQSLPTSTKDYLRHKYSQRQIEVFLGHLEIAVTHKVIPQHTQTISNFFATERWVRAFETQLEPSNAMQFERFRRSVALMPYSTNRNAIFNRRSPSHPMSEAPVCSSPQLQ